MAKSWFFTKIMIIIILRITYFTFFEEKTKSGKRTQKQGKEMKNILLKVRGVCLGMGTHHGERSSISLRGT